MSEGFQSELLEDNRVGARFNELLSAASRELKWVIDLPLHIYEKLASVADGSDPRDLKAVVIAAAHVSYHFVWRRVLHPASMYPWKLCRGDIAKNLEDLSELEDPPEEPCTKNLWELLQRGHSPVVLRKVVELLGECPWSSMPAEQQHASVALLHRWHQEYGLEQLISRSLLHQTVRLLPSESKTDKLMSKICKKMDRLDGKMPHRANGSHMLVAALVAVVKKRKDFVKIRHRATEVHIEFPSDWEQLRRRHASGMMSPLYSILAISVGQAMSLLSRYCFFWYTHSRFPSPFCKSLKGSWR